MEVQEETVTFHSQEEKRNRLGQKHGLTPLASQAREENGC